MLKEVDAGMQVKEPKTLLYRCLLDGELTSLRVARDSGFFIKGLFLFVPERKKTP